LEVSYCELLYFEINESCMFFFLVFVLIFGSFANHFLFKLKTYGSNLNSTFVIMSELKLFLLTRVLIQNFNTVDLVKFLEQNKKLHIQIVVVTLNMTTSKTMRKKEK
jgi:hypothetical protein